MKQNQSNESNTEPSSLQNVASKVEPSYVTIGIALTALSNAILLSKSDPLVKSIALGLFFMSAFATGLLYWSLLLDKAPLFMEEHRKQGYFSLRGIFWIIWYWMKMAFRLLFTTQGLSKEKISELGFLTVLGALFLLWVLSFVVAIYSFLLPTFRSLLTLRNAL